MVAPPGGKVNMVALHSSSQNVKWISNMGCFGTCSIMGGNIRLLIEKYDMNVKNVVKALKERITKNEELVRVCKQVKEVVGMRDRYIGSVMSQSECDDILKLLCFVHVLKVATKCSAPFLDHLSRYFGMVTLLCNAST